MNAEQLSKDIAETNAMLRTVWPDDYILPDTETSCNSGWDREMYWLSVVCYVTLAALILMPVSLGVYAYLKCC